MASRIEGLDRLNRKLRALPVVAQKRIREAMAEGAQEIVALAKSLAPYASLKESIDWTWGTAPKGAMTLARVVQTGGENVITIYAGNSEVFYARWVEFGTKAHKAGGMFEGAEIPAQAAKPFFFVSFRASRRKVKSRITRAINKAAKEVAAGGR